MDGGRQAPRRVDRRRVGHGQRRLRGGDVARDGRMRRRRQPGPARPHSQPRRLRERRSHHPGALAQRLRRGDPRGRRQDHRSRHAGGAAAGHRAEDGDDLHLRRDRATTPGRCRPKPSARSRSSTTSRSWSMPRPRSSRFRTSTCSAARRWSAYSGGKYIRGPQSAGLLLGRKDLVQAAWVHSAPHHGYARAMKVGREEIDRHAGRRRELGRSAITPPSGKSGSRAATTSPNASRRLPASPPHGAAGARRKPEQSQPARDARWDSRQLGHHRRRRSPICWTRASRESRWAEAAEAPAARQSPEGDASISITSAMMAPGDEKIVAQRIVRDTVGEAHAQAGRMRQHRRPPTCRGVGTSRFSSRRAATTHTLHLQQNGNRLEGTHQGNFLARDIAGTMSGDTVTLVERGHRTAWRCVEVSVQRQR